MSQFNESVSLHVHDLNESFEPQNLKPLIIIYNIINDCKLNYLTFEEDLEIYKDVVDFNRLKMELDLFYQMN